MALLLVLGVANGGTSGGVNIARDRRKSLPFVDLTSAAVVMLLSQEYCCTVERYKHDTSKYGNDKNDTIRYYIYIY